MSLLTISYKSKKMPFHFLSLKIYSGIPKIKIGFIERFLSPVEGIHSINNTAPWEKNKVSERVETKFYLKNCMRSRAFGIGIRRVLRPIFVALGE